MVRVLATRRDFHTFQAAPAHHADFPSARLVLQAMAHMIISGCLLGAFPATRSFHRAFQLWKVGLSLSRWLPYTRAQMSGLAAQLFREVRPDFFRVLTGPLARLYVDSLDTLECEAAQRSNGLGRDEALALVEQHADLSAEDSDPLAYSVAVRDQARVFLDTSKQAGWIEEPERSEWQPLIFVNSNGVLLLQALRKIAFQEAAVFSDKLVNVRVTLACRNSLAEQPCRKSKAASQMSSRAWLSCTVSRNPSSDIPNSSSPLRHSRTQTRSSKTARWPGWKDE